MTDLAAEARRLRAEEGLSFRQIKERLGVGKDRLRDWLRGVPPPEWTRRPQAKDDLRERALVMRGEGASVDEIAAAVGVSKSTAYLWVRHLPLTEADRKRRTAAAKARADARWADHRKDLATRRAEVALDAEEAVGTLSVRELMLIGAVMYWCEGAKEKRWRDQYRLDFINSDVGLLRLYLTFLSLMGVSRTQLVYRVAIHETADVEAAVRWWCEQLDLTREQMRRPTIKRHHPTTGRRNNAEDYHGCLIVTLPRSRELYWWIDAAMSAMASGAGAASAGSAIHSAD